MRDLNADTRGFVLQKRPSTSALRGSDVIILGVCYDGGSDGRPGARYAPDAIRRATIDLPDYKYWDSTRQRWIGRKIQITDAGNFSVSHGEDHMSVCRRLQSEVSELLSVGKHLLTLGGDHSMTAPIIRALYRHLGEPVSMVHFDCHTDTDPPRGRPNHGTWLREVIDAGCVAQVAQVGINHLCSTPSLERWGMNNNIRIWSQEEATDSPNTVANEVIGWLSHDRPVYYSLDMDVLDPAIAPGVGTFEPGGLTANQFLSMLRVLLDVFVPVAADIMEVCPIFDPLDTTASLAHNTALEFLSAWS